MSRRPPRLLLLALLSACATASVWLAAFGIRGARAFDAATMETFMRAARPPLTPSIQGVAVLADPLPFVAGGVLLAALAVARGRWLMAAAVPLILLGANVTTQLLKPALADPRGIELHGSQLIYPGSWPSGHSTAAMSLALCLVLVVGPRLRPLAALLGAAYAIAVGYALVVLGHHLPSDVLGGYLVAATFALLGAAALASLESRRPAVLPARRPLAIGTLAAIVAALAVCAAAGAALYAPGLTHSALTHPTAVAAALGMGALGVALTTGLAVVLRR